MIDEPRQMYDDEDNLTPEAIAWLLVEREQYDHSRPMSERHVDALAEDYDRDWSEALSDHDWFCNQCTGMASFNERCCKRQGHSGKHGAGFNARMQFIYSEEKVNALIYSDNPFLRMVRR